MEGRAYRSSTDRVYLLAFVGVAFLHVASAVYQLVAGTPVPETILAATVLVVACMMRTHGFRGTLRFVGLVLAIPFGSEFLGVLTGIPYGSYAYVATPGPRVLGLVPALIFIAWVNIAYLSIATTTIAFGRSRLWLAPVDGLIATGWDVIVDPLAVRYNYWTWLSPGGFYGVPLSNFLGWFVVVTALSLAARWVWTHDIRAPVRTSRTVVWLLPALLLASALQYGALAIVYGFLAAAVIGLGILLAAVAAAWDRIFAMPRATFAPNPWIPSAPARAGFTAGR